MKSSKASGIFRPFEDLDILLKNRPLPPKPVPAKPIIPEPGPESGAENDHHLFKTAMADVKPISGKKGPKKLTVRGKRREPPEKTDERETLHRLQKLIEHGDGFVVADTPEYIEGVGYHVNQAMTRHLHRRST